MLALITKASDNDYYKFDEIDTMNDLLKIEGPVIVSGNEFSYWTITNILRIWGVNEKDAYLIQEAECHITIYDDYIE